MLVAYNLWHKNVSLSGGDGLLRMSFHESPHDASTLDVPEEDNSRYIHKCEMGNPIVDH